MSIVTYSNAAFGFGVTYDDGEITHTDDPADPRLRAAWAHRVPTPIAAGVLFTTRDADLEGIARGLTPSLLVTTDNTPLPAGAIGTWDWEEVTRREGGRFLARTRASAVEAAGVYWRGYPVLQLTAVPAADADPPAPVEVLGMLYTPAQTFASLLVIQPGDAVPWTGRLQEVADGFFLLPIEREGRVRTGHQHVRSVRLEADGTEDERGVRRA